MTIMGMTNMHIYTHMHSQKNIRRMWALEKKANLEKQKCETDKINDRHPVN